MRRQWHNFILDIELGRKESHPKEQVMFVVQDPLGFS